MSTAYAIAAVTAVLKTLLDNGLKAAGLSGAVGSDVTVSALPPDRISINNGGDPNQLNLFLYQVTSNQGWRNVDLPSRNALGERISSPPLALNLHYLLTAYGAKDLYAEIILGHAMQLLHESPVLTQEAIRKALPDPPPAGTPKELSAAHLADQVEHLRVTPEMLNTEEVSKLWSAMQAHYRPTAAYQVTVVLIESSRSVKSSLPVRERNLYVLPFHQPVIERIISAAGENTPIVATSALLIRGQRLQAQDMKVLIGGVDLTSAISASSDAEIKIQFPAPLPGGLYAGVQPVQVVHQIRMGTPPTLHRGVESNVEAFVLRPTLTPTVDSAVADGLVDSQPAKKGEIKITFNPKVSKTQRVVLLLNEFDPPPNRPARAYSFTVLPGNGIVDPATETDTIKISYRKVIAGAYLVRVRVDGAESLLDVDGTGKYASPQVTI